MATETKESTLSTGKPTPKLFLHVTFETPQPVGGGEEDVQRSDCDGDKVMGDSGSSDQSTPTLTLITKQKFDASNCKTAEIGLPDGVQPVKPDAGDYTYSGMHDHGPLPQPKEGGQFANIIGLVNEAKKASNEYLTEMIEKEKAYNDATNGTEEKGGQHKRKR